ncbi:ankyrin repeat domain-containing protein 54, partial [Notothenia coriiceps]|uniref:Ankyrin repeat domain-containing protein 54 n=1 Tax=Notothenia coriiceps TaxID=8208 RepID=A0A6I9PRS4_9TELE
MDGWSPIVASDTERSSSEGEYMLEPGAQDGSLEAGEGESMAPSGGTTASAASGSSAAVGFGMSGTGEGKLVLGRVGPRDDTELRVLHLLWERGGEALSSRAGKVSCRRNHRLSRSVGPLGKDIYAVKRLREAANSNDIDTGEQSTYLDIITKT